MSAALHPLPSTSAHTELDLLTGADPLGAARRAVRLALTQGGWTDGACDRVDLVLEELVGNAWRHGLAALAQPRLHLAWWLQGDEVCLRLCDNGWPFDPTQHAEPPRPASLAQAQPGGLGLPLVRRQVQAWQYQRSGDSNLLHLWLRQRSQPRTATPAALPPPHGGHTAG